MPAFGATLTDQDIRSMVIYIRELRDRAATGAIPRNAAPPPLPTDVVRSERQGFRIETVVEGLQNPWAAAILPDGALLVPERSGRLRIVRNGVPEAPITGTNSPGLAMRCAAAPAAAVIAKNNKKRNAPKRRATALPNANSQMALRPRCEALPWSSA